MDNMTFPRDNYNNEAGTNIPNPLCKRTYKYCLVPDYSRVSDPHVRRLSLGWSQKDVKIRTWT